MGDSRVPGYALRKARKAPEEIRAEARAGEFRGPGSEVLSAIRACLRQAGEGGVSVAYVTAFLAGWPNLGEKPTEDLALAGLQALRTKGQAGESPIWGWYPTGATKK